MSEEGCASRSGADYAQMSAEEQALQSNLARIKNKFVALSGKGGVGKSTVAVNLAPAGRGNQ